MRSTRHGNVAGPSSGATSRPSRQSAVVAASLCAASIPAVETRQFRFITEGPPASSREYHQGRRSHAVQEPRTARPAAMLKSDGGVDDGVSWEADEPQTRQPVPPPRLSTFVRGATKGRSRRLDAMDGVTASPRMPEASTPMPTATTGVEETARATPGLVVPMTGRGVAVRSLVPLPVDATTSSAEQLASFLLGQQLQHAVRQSASLHAIPGSGAARKKQSAPSRTTTKHTEAPVVLLPHGPSMPNPARLPTEQTNSSEALAQVQTGSTRRLHVSAFGVEGGAEGASECSGEEPGGSATTAAQSPTNAAGALVESTFSRALPPEAPNVDEADDFRHELRAALSAKARTALLSLALVREAKAFDEPDHSLPIRATYAHLHDPAVVLRDVPADAAGAGEAARRLRAAERVDDNAPQWARWEHALAQHVPPMDPLDIPVSGVPQQYGGTARTVTVGNANAADLLLQPSPRRDPHPLTMQASLSPRPPSAVPTAPIGPGFPMFGFLAKSTVTVRGRGDAQFQDGTHPQPLAISRRRSMMLAGSQSLQQRSSIVSALQHELSSQLGTDGEGEPGNDLSNSSTRVPPRMRSGSMVAGRRRRQSSVFLPDTDATDGSPDAPPLRRRISSHSSAAASVFTAVGSSEGGGVIRGGERIAPAPERPSIPVGRRASQDLVAAGLVSARRLRSYANATQADSRTRFRNGVPVVVSAPAGNDDDADENNNTEHASHRTATDRPSGTDGRDAGLQANLSNPLSFGNASSNHPQPSAASGSAGPEYARVDATLHTRDPGPYRDGGEEVEAAVFAELRSEADQYLSHAALHSHGAAAASGGLGGGGGGGAAGLGRLGLLPLGAPRQEEDHAIAFEKGLIARRLMRNRAQVDFEDRPELDTAAWKAAAARSLHVGRDEVNSLSIAARMQLQWVATTRAQQQQQHQKQQLGPAVVPKGHQDHPILSMSTPGDENLGTTAEGAIDPTPVPRSDGASSLPCFAARAMVAEAQHKAAVAAVEEGEVGSKADLTDSMLRPATTAVLVNDRLRT